MGSGVGHAYTQALPGVRPDVLVDYSSQTNSTCCY